MQTRNMQGIGELDERTFMEILEESKRLNINPVYIPLPGGESVEDVQKRAEEFIEVTYKFTYSLPSQ